MRSAKNKPTKTFINQDTPPYPYVISLWKFFILSIVTFGLFECYWFYRQWKSFYAIANIKHGRPYLLFVTIFYGVSSFFLFERIENEVKEINPAFILRPYVLAATYLVLNSLYKLPHPYWIISLLSVLVFLPVQHAINYYWEQKYGERIIKSGFGKGNIATLIVGGIILLLALIDTFTARG